MNSPAPNIPGAVSAMSPFTEYIMNELELEATSDDDIRAGDETLDAIFAEDHAHDVGGDAASAGRTPVTPQEGNELKLEATSEDDIHAGDERTLDAIFAEDHALGWWRSIVGRSHSLLWTSIKSHLPMRESMPP